MTGDKIKGFLVDVKNGKAEVLEFVDELENLYQLCDCRCIDIPMRKVGKFDYDIVCDDEGLLTESPVVSAFNAKGEPMLVGNLLFVNHNEDGDLASLRDEQIKDLQKHIGQYIRTVDDTAKAVKCVINMDYC